MRGDAQCGNSHARGHSTGRQEHRIGERDPVKNSTPLSLWSRILRPRTRFINFATVLYAFDDRVQKGASMAFSQHPGRFLPVSGFAETADRTATKCPIRNEIGHFCCVGNHALEQIAWFFFLCEYSMRSERSAPRCLKICASEHWRWYRAPATPCRHILYALDLVRMKVRIDEEKRSSLAVYTEIIKRGIKTIICS